jgi:hypothetical protein
MIVAKVTQIHCRGRWAANSTASDWVNMRWRYGHRRFNQSWQPGFTFWTCHPGRSILFTQEGPNSSVEYMLAPDNCPLEANHPELNRPCRLTNDPFTQDSNAAARSLHAGVVYVLMADSSTHFAANDIDLEMWRGMSTFGGEKAKSLAL